MNKIINIVCLIVAGILLLAVGAFGGVLLERKVINPKFEKMDTIAEEINSKLIISMVAFGKVAKISDRTITLTYGTENLAIRIKEDAEILSFNAPVLNDKGEQVSPGVPGQKNAEFKDIKIGDNLNIRLNILPDGELVGVSVMVFPGF